MKKIILILVLVTVAFCGLARADYDNDGLLSSDSVNVRQKLKINGVLTVWDSAGVLVARFDAITTGMIRIDSLQCMMDLTLRGDPTGCNVGIQIGNGADGYETGVAVGYEARARHSATAVGWRAKNLTDELGITLGAGATTVTGMCITIGVACSSNVYSNIGYQSMTIGGHSKTDSGGVAIGPYTYAFKLNSGILGLAKDNSDTARMQNYWTIKNIDNDSLRGKHAWFDTIKTAKAIYLRATRLDSAYVVNDSLIWFVAGVGYGAKRR